MSNRWADMTDDDPIEPWAHDDDNDPEIPVTISKHGIKVKNVQPHSHQDKTKPTVDSKK
jgi:hypothetical protein